MNPQMLAIQDKLGPYYRPLVLLCLSVALFLLGFQWVLPQNISIRSNEVADMTIRAPYTTIDEQVTAQSKQRASDAVLDVYSYQPEIREEQLSILEQYFGGIRQLRKETFTSQLLLTYLDELGDDPTMRAKIQGADRTLTQRVQFAQLDQDEKLLALKYQLLTAPEALTAFSQELADQIHQSILLMQDQDIIDIQSALTNILSELLSQEIKADQVQTYHQQAIQLGQAAVDTNQKQAVMEAFLDQLVVATMVYNEEATQEARNLAADQVPSTYILQGQVIVQEDFVTDAEMMRKLNIYGLLDQQSSYLSLVIYAVLIICHALILAYSLSRAVKTGGFSQKQANAQVTAYSLSLLIAFSLLLVFRAVAYPNFVNGLYLYPAGLLTLLILQGQGKASLYFAYLSFSSLGLYVLNAQSDFSNAVVAILYFLLSNLMVLLLGASTKGWDRLKRHLIGQIILSVVFLLAINLDFSAFETYQQLGMMILSIIGCHILYFFVSPYWMQLFDDKAQLTLNQLANLNHPLLKRLIEEAPGTYHHSILVANLSANAVDAIGGDALFTRVASYYHDIGKTKHPLFFVENLPAGMVSPHQMISPKESAQIIIGHVLEGEKILREAMMPESIIDVCLQHHGSTQVSYFYHQEKEVNPDAQMEDFTYPGPLPQNKETAVIMIADSVEAASRSLKDHSQAAIEGLVGKIIDGKIANNQFADSGLTVHELKLVKSSLIQGLAGMFHTRIEYPD